jgi:hypothetical protein
MKHTDHILKSSGFKVPKDYFKDFKVTKDDLELRQSKSGFTLPESYFEEFDLKTPQVTKVRRLNEVYKTIAVAASLLVILGTLLMGLFFNQKSEPSLNFSKIDRSEIENYLEDELLMDHDLYVEDNELKLDFNSNNLTENTVIEDMDDSSLEQLMDY